MEYTSRRTYIAGTGSYVPVGRFNTDDIGLGAEKAAWVKNTLGIYQRRIAAALDHTSDLAAWAGAQALASAGVATSEVGAVIVATSTPDKQAPSTACIVADKLGLSSSPTAFDVNAVCSGFMYALTLGSMFIHNFTCENVLVIGADTYSKVTNWNDRSRIFFGDGAGAVVLKYRSESIFHAVLHSDGSGRDAFTIPIGGTFTMDAPAVAETATRVLPEALAEVLKLADYTTADIDIVVPHQPSKQILLKTAERAGIPIEKIAMNMNEYGNTAAATIPLLFDKCVRGGRIKRGDLVALCAVGAGWTWGAGLLRY